MSIMFLEPGHPEPGHVHQGQLQLVEVSGAGWTQHGPEKAKRGQDCGAHSCWEMVQEQDRAHPTLAFEVARGQRSQPTLPSTPCSQPGPPVCLCPVPSPPVVFIFFEEF